MEKTPRLSPHFSIILSNHTDIHSIIAVHGIGAHPDRSWTMQKSNGEWVNWLTNAEMLPRNLPNARILRFGYRSAWFGPANLETKKTLVQDVAKMLLKGLEHCRDASQPECFVHAASTNRIQGSNSTTTIHCSQFWRPRRDVRSTPLFRSSR